MIPWTVVRQAPLSMEFSRQEFWSEVKVAQLCPTLWPHRLYSPWNSPGQNTGVGSLSLLQRIFQTQGSNPGLPHCRQILYQLIHKGGGSLFPSPGDLPDPGIKPRSPALQADSLSSEPPGKPVGLLTTPSQLSPNIFVLKIHLIQNCALGLTLPLFLLYLCDV